MISKFRNKWWYLVFIQISLCFQHIVQRAVLPLVPVLVLHLSSMKVRVTSCLYLAVKARPCDVKPKLGYFDKRILNWNLGRVPVFHELYQNIAYMWKSLNIINITAWNIYLSVSLSLSTTICLSIYLSIYLSISVCLPAYLSVCIDTSPTNYQVESVLCSLSLMLIIGGTSGKL